MIYNNLELHNFAEVCSIEERPGVLLQRIPEEVRVQLREGAKAQYRKAAGGEIRFVAETYPVRLTLACYGGVGKACIYFGDYQGEEYIIKGEPTVIEVKPNPKISGEISLLPETTFSPRVVRVILEGDQIHLLNTEGDGIRPPVNSELPRLTYLAYGTSITQGTSCTTPMLSYVKQTAWRLGADSINLGCGGNAYCEKAIADYISGSSDWDFATLCISVNMLNQGVSLQEFKQKAEYFVYTIAGKNPLRLVVCIGLYPYFLDMGIRNPGQNPVSTPGEYRNALKELVNSSGLENLYYIDGRELLKSFGALSADLIHPGNLGMIQIGENLAKLLEPLVQKIRAKIR